MISSCAMLSLNSRWMALVARNTWMRCFARRLDGLRHALDVVAIAAREAADDRSLHLARHRVHALPVAARGGGEARFDNVDPKVRKRARHPQLLGLRHAAARRLLAVAQRRVEDHDSFAIGTWESPRVVAVVSRDLVPATACGRAAACADLLDLVIEIGLHERVVVLAAARRSRRSTAWRTCPSGFP